MTSDTFTYLLLLLPIAAALYASVGHGGASAYLAVMALVGLPNAEARVIALILNCLVATGAYLQFRRVASVPWRMLAVLLASSVPFAYLGGTISIQEEVYRPLLGCVLAVAAVRMAWQSRINYDEIRTAQWWQLVPVSAVIGFLSGVLGIGGGVLLSPIILLLRWSTPKETAVISALYIVVNSAAVLFGVQQIQIAADPSVIVLIGCTMFAGLFGAYLGSRRYSSISLRRVLAGVLLIASFKLVVT